MPCGVSRFRFHHFAVRRKYFINYVAAVKFTILLELVKC